MNLVRPLEPRERDGELRVLIPGRISTPGQDAESIVSTQEDAEKWLRRVYAGPVNVIRVGEQASGWLVERPSMTTAKNLIVTGAVDLVLVTEVARNVSQPDSAMGIRPDLFGPRRTVHLAPRQYRHG